MQPEQPSEHHKDPRATELGQRGGQKRMAQLNPQQRSELARHAAYAKHHPYQFKLQRERAEELARVVKQALDNYLPGSNHGAA